MDSLRVSKKLNIGCGTDYKSDWVNIDVSPEVKADHYLDIQKDQLPATDASIDEIYCSGVLEQILFNNDFVHYMNEAWRVLNNNGVMTVIVPSAKYSIAYRDPFDCRRFTEDTFKYIQYNERHYHKYGKVYGFKPWLILTCITNEQGIMTLTMQKYV